MCFSAGHVIKVDWILNHEFCSCSFTSSSRLSYVRKVRKVVCRNSNESELRCL